MHEIYNKNADAQSAAIQTTALISCFRDPNIKHLLLFLNLEILKWPFKVRKKVVNLHKKGPNSCYTLKL